MPRITYSDFVTVLLESDAPDSVYFVAAVESEESPDEDVERAQDWFCRAWNRDPSKLLPEHLYGFKSITLRGKMWRFVEDGKEQEGFEIDWIGHTACYPADEPGKLYS